jgi:hypothetical protein
LELSRVKISTLKSSEATFSSKSLAGERRWVEPFWSVTIVTIVTLIIITLVVIIAFL